MATSVPLIWAPRSTGSNALLPHFCAVAAAKARVDLQATPFKPTVRVAWMGLSPFTAHNGLRPSNPRGKGQRQGLLEPARPAQRIRSWRLRQPWQQWLLGQPVQRE